MPRSMKDEYGFDPSLEDGALPREFSRAEEISRPAPEFGGASGPSNVKLSHHERLKKLFLMPLAAAVAVVSIVFASLGSDPLGNDFLNKTSVAPASPSGTETDVAPDSDKAPDADTTPADTGTDAPDTEKAPDEYDDSFPTLPNADPDFAGDYAWAGMGSEEYLIVDGNFLHCGTFYTDGGYTTANIPGAEYDRTTNTLTLTNFHGDSIDANLMGNGFKIKLVGDCSLGFVQAWGAMYGGSITFTGDGSLTVNADRVYVSGINLNCEDSPSCIMIDRDVTIEIFGSADNPAIAVSDSTLDETVVYLKPIEMTGELDSSHVIFAPAK